MYVQPLPITTQKKPSVSFLFPFYLLLSPKSCAIIEPTLVWETFLLHMKGIKIGHKSQF